MRLSSIDIGSVVLTAVTLAVASPSFGAEVLAWGPAVNGFQLAAAFGSELSPTTVRVALRNIGSEPKDVMLGHKAGEFIYDSLRFTAIAPDGKQEELLHRSLYAPIAGLLLPYAISINAGGTHELEFPMKDIIYASGMTVTLGDLVNQGYSVRVRFEANQRDARWAKLSQPWIGALISADVSRAR